MSLGGTRWVQAERRWWGAEVVWLFDFLAAPKDGIIARPSTETGKFGGRKTPASSISRSAPNFRSQGTWLGENPAKTAPDFDFEAKTMRTHECVAFLAVGVILLGACSVGSDGLEVICSAGTIVLCPYSGPPAAEGVGACRAGTKSCLPDGRGYGGCEGELLPSIESCATPLDDDCDGSVNEEGEDCACVPGTMAACYSGPPPSLGVGACHSGTQSCKPDGSGFAECIGEVLPVSESCETAADDDCDGLVNEEGEGCACAPGSAVICYSGPASTEGVGACHGGLQVCALDGTGFGTCLAEVVPGPETCMTPVDDDCDGLVNEDGAGCTCVPGEIGLCYTGPGGTEGIGICQSGFHTCDPQGTAFGPCIGEVLPGAEDCATPEDDDCDGVANQACSCVPNAVASCYSGAADTVGIGQCSPGTQTCDSAGLGFGACTGEVLPAFEHCNSPTDENCDGFAYCTGGHEWSFRFGDNQVQQALALAVDGSGSVIIGGYMKGTVDFGSGPLPAGTDIDAFVAKFDAFGVPQWSKFYGDSATQVVYGVAADDLGSVIAAGYFVGTVDFGCGALTAQSQAGGSTLDAFVVKLDREGACLWSKSFGGPGTEIAFGVATDASGNVVVAGEFDASIDLGTGPLSTAGATDAFVVYLANDGSPSWGKRFGDASGSQYARAVAIDPGSGNVTIVGHFGGSVDFGGGALVDPGGSNIFVTQFTMGGNHVWSKGFGDNSPQRAYGVALDSGGNIAVVGYNVGTVDFGGVPLTSAGGEDVVIAKLAANGSHQWSKKFGDGSNYQVAPGVAFDQDDNIVLGAYFYGSVDFGGGVLDSVGQYDAAIAKFDPNGVHLWSKRFGDIGDEVLEGVAVDNFGSVFLTGEFNSSIDLGGGAMVSLGNHDVFLGKLLP